MPDDAHGDVEVLGPEAEIVGEWQAIAAAHELHASEQVAGGLFYAKQQARVPSPPGCALFIFRARYAVYNFGRSG